MCLVCLFDWHIICHQFFRLFSGCFLSLSFLYLTIIWIFSTLSYLNISIYSLVVLYQWSLILTFNVEICKWKHFVLNSVNLAVVVYVFLHIWWLTKWCRISPMNRKNHLFNYQIIVKNIYHCTNINWIKSSNSNCPGKEKSNRLSPLTLTQI
jgi:hypothetical protein